MISSLIYSKTSNEFLVRAPVLDGKNGDFRHVMRVQYGESSIQTPLTYGHFDVTVIYGWDQQNNYM